jgi:hypothetical protein
MSFGTQRDDGLGREQKRDAIAAAFCRAVAPTANDESIVQPI